MMEEKGKGGESGDKYREGASVVLQPEDGFVFEQAGENEVALMRRSDGLGIATIGCGCTGDGSCKIVIDVGTGSATCRGGCSGGCAWVIGVTGLSNRLALA